MPAPGPRWEAADLDRENGYRRVDPKESLYTAANRDLCRYRAAGDKLLMHEGWNDAFVPPGSVIDYCETVERTMGKHTATQDFIRPFMLPGLDHCVEGAGADGRRAYEE